MKATLTPIASAVAFALIGSLAQAQQAPAQPGAEKKSDGKPVQVAQANTGAAAAGAAAAPEQVVVTGIRGSLQQSLAQKRSADGHTEVITAEDIGKMPDKNVADSLQRVPGVTISSAGATEGGFDENDRVSMRGTNPSLTLTQINGHPVSSGDWFVLNQSDNAGRSVSYTLLPSELVSKIVVHKTSEASLVEGGVAGTVDVVTRKPLEFRQQFTLEGSLGAVHATLPNKTDGQFNALLNYKNDAGTAGVLVQLFSEKRHLRRDGFEILGYNQIAAGSPVALAHPDLAGVYYPRSMGAALFEQERKREGGLLEVQVKPINTLSLDLSAYSSKMDAANYNRNYLLHAPFFLNEGKGQSPDAGYVVRNNTLVSASFSGVPGSTYGVYDQISRPDESASTTFVNFDANWRASDALSLNFKGGTSTGKGLTPTQNVAEWDIGKGTGASWQLNGVDSAANFSLNSPANTPAGRSLDWIFGYQNVNIKDKDDWAQIDGEYALDSGVLSSLKFGVRSAKHTRDALGTIAQGPSFNPDAFNLANWPSSYANYPGNFGSSLGGNFPRDVWYYTFDQMNAVAPGLSNRDPKARAYPLADSQLDERTDAAYVQANLEGKGWRGNVGLRLVKTKEHVVKWINVPDTAPGAVLGSAFGAFLPVATDHSYTDVLPSFNLRVDLAKDLVGRLAVTKTMTRPDYAALAGALNLSPPANQGDVGQGNGSNPDLKPIRSTNFDAAVEWYYAPRALLSAGVYYMDLKSYVGLGQVKRQYITFDKNNLSGYMADYVLSVPVNSSGKVKGFELAWEQPFGNFGVTANYTYTDAKETGGGPIVGASRDTYNLVGYYEDDRFNVRLAYNFRSHFFSGLDRSTAFNQADTATLAASLGYRVSDKLSFSFDAMNLNNPKLKYYALNEDQPRSIYTNGRQYYLTARVKY
ncbi:TonB-dependent receptor [Aquabacterium sp.]|uniref:TonB-dependent receptor n=1 Tax=Aquabacterium sp. TaxID=1872578 RepID=UPI0037834F1F